MLEKINTLLCSCNKGFSLQDQVSFTSITSFYLVNYSNDFSNIYHYTLPFDPILIKRLNFRIDKIQIINNYLHCIGEKYVKMNIKTTQFEIFDYDYQLSNFSLKNKQLYQNSDLIYTFEEKPIKIFEFRTTLAVQFKSQLVFYTKTQHNIFLKQIIYNSPLCFQYNNLLLVFDNQLTVYDNCELQTSQPTKFVNFLQIGSHIYCQQNNSLKVLIVSSDDKKVLIQTVDTVSDDFLLGNNILYFDFKSNLKFKSQKVQELDLGVNLQALQFSLQYSDRKEEHTMSQKLETQVKVLEMVLDGNFINKDGKIVDTEKIYQTVQSAISQFNDNQKRIDTPKCNTKIQKIYDEIKSYPIKLYSSNSKIHIEITQQIIRIYDLFQQIEKSQQKLYTERNEQENEILIEDLDAQKIMEESTFTV